uniref:hypothetical protein n=1 Tax=uncultured Acinetobacter sp. TaxID=165433 RepID=UPI0026391614|nr:hypothetical protein [uncultured Acinetobacter sp.]
MKKDDFEQKIVNALNVKANQQMQFKHAVIDNVFDRIEQQRHERFNRWGLAGFALAAAITGVAVVPSSFFDNTTDQQATITSTKLSPQLADDLEMLLVLGEDATHGS